MRSFSSIARAGLAAASLLAAAGALACQPPSAPPPPPAHLPGETPEEYRARLIAAMRAHDERKAAELREGQLRRETWLWGEAATIFAAEVIEGPRVTSQRPTHRMMAIRLRPLAAARGAAPRKPFTLRYRLDFNICGYDDTHHFRAVQAGDAMVLFAGAGKLSYAALLDGISQSNAVKDETVTLLRQARP